MLTTASRRRISCQCPSQSVPSDTVVTATSRAGNQQWHYKDLDADRRLVRRWNEVGMA